MAKHAILNPVEHKALRVQTGYGAEYGDDVMCVLAIPSEFRSLQADYPIFLHWDGASRKYLPMAICRFIAQTTGIKKRGSFFPSTALLS